MRGVEPEEHGRRRLEQRTARRCLGRSALWASRSSATATGARTSPATSPSAPSSSSSRCASPMRPAREPSPSATRTSRWSRDLADVLANDEVEAVLVATPPQTHFPIVKQALEAGRHVLVEKPLATTVRGRRASSWRSPSRKGLVLMPGHTFVYSPAVNTVRDLIRDGVVGEVYFVTSSRMNLGKYQRDGVICDLAPHDLSILLYWLERARRAGRRDGPQRLPGRRPGDRVPHPDLRERDERERPGLLARAAQGPPDGRGREQADGRLRRHPVRRARPRLRPRHGLHHARELRRVPAHLPQRRHRDPAHRCLRSRWASSSRTSRRPSGRAACPAPTPRSGSRSSIAMEAAEASLRRNGHPISLDAVLAERAAA